MYNYIIILNLKLIILVLDLFYGILFWNSITWYWITFSNLLWSHTFTVMNHIKNVQNLQHSNQTLHTFAVIYYAQIVQNIQHSTQTLRTKFTVGSCPTGCTQTNVRSRCVDTSTSIQTGVEPCTFIFICGKQRQRYFAIFVFLFAKLCHFWLSNNPT